MLSSLHFILATSKPRLWTKALTWKTVGTQMGRKTRSPDAEVQHRLVWTVKSLLETSTQAVKVQHPNHDRQPLPSTRDAAFNLPLCYWCHARQKLWQVPHGGDVCREGSLGMFACINVGSLRAARSLRRGSRLWELSHVSLPSQGWESDAEAEQVFKMETAQRNRGRFPPPPPPQRKQGLENGQHCTSPLARYCKCTGAT